MPFALVVALVLAVVSATFAIQNADPVSVDFLGWQWEASLALILILSLAAGAPIGDLVGLPRSLSLASEGRKMRKRITDLETQRQQPPGLESIKAAQGVDDEPTDRLR